jgi:hypothetical protein
MSSAVEVATTYVLVATPLGPREHEIAPEACGTRLRAFGRQTRGKYTCTSTAAAASAHLMGCRCALAASASTRGEGGRSRSSSR